MIHDPNYYANYLAMFRRWEKEDSERAITLSESDPYMASYYRGQRDMERFIISMLKSALEAE